jgi:hypothetical protein
MNFEWQCRHCSHVVRRATMFVLKLDAFAHSTACAEKRALEAKKKAARDAQPSLFDSTGGAMR